jgi:hypothetical protein
VSHAAAGVQTLHPTPRYQFIVGNGGCPVGTNLYQVIMFDSFGDGWDGTKMKITGVSAKTHKNQGYHTTSNYKQNSVTYHNTVATRNESTTAVVVFQGKLTAGSVGRKFTCLQPSVCYTVQVDGGIWENEVSWERKFKW